MFLHTCSRERRAKKAATDGPVLITDRGKPAHVLLSTEEYRRITASRRTACTCPPSRSWSSRSAFCTWHVETVQGAMLRAWIDNQVLPEFADCTLPVDTAVARCGARLHVPDRRGERDALIAATALVHGMTVVTRNVADFEPTGVRLLDPGNDVEAG